MTLPAIEILVGDTSCHIETIAEMLGKCGIPGAVRLGVHWKDFAYALNESTIEVNRLELLLKASDSSIQNVYRELLIGWKSRKGDNATLQELMNILQSMQCNEMAQKLHIFFRRKSCCTTTEPLLQENLSTHSEPKYCLMVLPQLVRTVGMFLLFVVALVLFVFTLPQLYHMHTRIRSKSVNSSEPSIIGEILDTNLNWKYPNHFPSQITNQIQKSFQAALHNEQLHGQSKYFVTLEEMPNLTVSVSVRNGSCNNNRETLCNNTINNYELKYIPAQNLTKSLSVNSEMQYVEEIEMNNFFSRLNVLDMFVNAPNLRAVSKLKMVNCTIDELNVLSIENFLKKFSQSLTAIDLNIHLQTTKCIYCVDTPNYYVTSFVYNISAGENVQEQSVNTRFGDNICKMFPNLEIFEGDNPISYSSFVGFFKCKKLKTLQLNILLGDDSGFFDSNELYKGSNLESVKVSLVFTHSLCPFTTELEKLGILKLRKRIQFIHIASNCCLTSSGCQSNRTSRVTNSFEYVQFNSDV